MKHPIWFPPPSSRPWRVARLPLLRVVLLLLTAALLLTAPSTALAQGKASYVDLSFTPGTPTYVDASTAIVIVRDGDSGIGIREAGSITTSVDGGPQKTSSLAQATAYVKLGQLPIGSHTVAVSFAGTANYAASSTSTVLTVTDAPFQFVGTQGTTLFVNGSVFGPAAVAVDRNDSLYEADAGLSNVRKEDVFGTLTTLPFTGLKSPNGIAVDGGGNVYLSDTGNSRLLKLTPAGVQSVVAVAGLTNATYLAYDLSNDLLYIADPSNGRVVQFNPVTGTQKDAITELTGLRGIAVLPQGQLLLADRFAGFLEVESDGEQIPIYAPIQEPGGVAVGPDGSLILSDTATNTVIRRDASGNQVQLNDAGNPVIGMATDSMGRVYLALGGRVDVLTPGAGRVPDEVVGDTSGYNAFESMIFQTPRSQAAITITPGPANTFDPFNTVACFGSTGGCVGAVRFTPQVAGVNTGTLSFSQGAASGAVQLWGKGIGGQPAFTPGVTSEVASEVSAIGGVALGPDGNRYVTDTAKAVVFQVTPAGVATQIPFTGLTAPTQIAVDAAGGLYVLDAGSVLHRDPAGKQTVAFTPSEGTITDVAAFALDGDANLVLAGVVAGQANSTARTGKHAGATARARARLAAQTPGGPATGSYSIVRTTRADLPAAQLSAPEYSVYTSSLGPIASVTADAYGGVYAVETSGNLWRWRNLNDADVSTPLVSGLVSPVGIVADAAPNVYVASANSGNITVVAPDGTQSTLAVNGASAQAALAGDLYGDLLVGDTAKDQLFFLDRTQQDYAFGNVPVGSSATLPGSVSNIGNQLLSVPLLPASDVFAAGPGSAECMSGNSALSQLTLGATCGANYVFTPPGAGPFTSSAKLGGFAAGSPGLGAMQFSGTGGAAATPTATLTPATFDYASVTVGTKASQTFTLANTGTTAFTIASVALPNSAFALASASCGSSLAAGASCTYVVAFGPTAAGVQSTTLTVTDDAGTQSAALTGTGVAPAAPQAALTPATAHFGSVTTGIKSSAQSFTLANAGNAALSITSVELSGAGAGSFAVSGNTCGSSLAAGASCMVQVVFAPQSAGAITATLAVVDAVGTQGATLTGTGTVPAVPQAKLSPGSADFGTVSVGSSGTAQSFTLANGGNAVLAVSSVALSGAGAGNFAITANTCGASLGAGATCTVGVNFSPAAGGAATATLSVVDAVGTQTAALTGMAVVPVPADFSLTATPAVQSGYFGTTLTYTLQLASVDATNPFTSAVGLAVTGLPAGATVNFSPATVVPGTKQATSTMSVQLPTLNARNTLPEQSGSRRTPVSLAVGIASLACAVVTRRRRRLPLLLVLGLLTAAGVSGLLSGYAATGNGFAIPQTTYTLLVNGTAGATIHTATVTLTVK